MVCAGTESDIDFLFSNPDSDYDAIDLLERRVRDAALRFMVELLQGYRSFIRVPSPADPFSPLFDADDFVAARSDKSTRQFLTDFVEQVRFWQLT